MEGCSIAPEHPGTRVCSCEMLMLHSCLKHVKTMNQTEWSREAIGAELGHRASVKEEGS